MNAIKTINAAKPKETGKEHVNKTIQTVTTHQSKADCMLQFACENPQLLSSAYIMQFQSLAGNRFVTQLLKEADSEDESMFHSNPLQRVRINLNKGDGYKNIGDLSYLETIETQVLSKYGAVGNVNFRAGNLNEAKLTVGDVEKNAVKDVDARRKTEETKLTRDEKGRDTKAASEKYEKWLNNAYHILKLNDKYSRLDNITHKPKVDSVLAALGTNMANITAVVNNLLADVGDLTLARELLADAIKHNKSVEDTGFPDYINRVEAAIVPLLAKLNTTPAKYDHSASIEIETRPAAAAAVFNAVDNSNQAILDEIVEFKAGIVPDDHFKDAVAQVARGSLLGNAMAAGDFLAPAGNLVGLGHFTVHGGASPYRGRSVWGKYSGGKLEVWALAEHRVAGNNKTYARVSGTAGIPGQWDLRGG